MKKTLGQIVLIFLVFLTLDAQAQNGMWQTTSAGGSTLDPERRFMARTCAGQAGPTGTFYTASGLTVRQGFIQPMTGFGWAPESRDLLIHLFPNPASDGVTIQIKEPGITGFEVVISDLTGRKVQSDSFPDQNEGRVFIGTLPDGMYLIGVRSGMKHKTARIIKQ